jgi:hypothetical protein
MKKIIIKNAHTGETTEVKDVTTLGIIKGIEKDGMVELADGTWLKSMGDGRYYDEKGGQWATVETALFDDDGNLDYSTEFHGYIKV